jgi:integrase
MRFRRRRDPRHQDKIKEDGHDPDDRSSASSAGPRPEKNRAIPYVFCHFEGDQAGLPIGNIKKSWKTVLKAAGIIRPFRLHDLRHPCASQLVMNGASLMAVKRNLRPRIIEDHAEVCSFES